MFLLADEPFCNIVLRRLDHINSKRAFISVSQNTKPHEVLAKTCNIDRPKKAVII